MEILRTLDYYGLSSAEGKQKDKDIEYLSHQSNENRH